MDHFRALMYTMMKACHHAIAIQDATNKEGGSEEYDKYDEYDEYDDAPMPGHILEENDGYDDPEYWMRQTRESFEGLSEALEALSEEYGIDYAGLTDTPAFAVPEYFHASIAAEIAESDEDESSADAWFVKVMTTLSFYKNGGTPLFDHAISAYRNLIGTILGSTYNKKPLYEVLVKNPDSLDIPGLSLFSKGPKKYLNIKWDKIGEYYLGLRESAYVKQFVAERTEACTEIGLFDTCPAAEIDKRRRGLAVDITLLYE